MARRPNFTEFQKQVQFQHDKFPPEKFLIMHPTTRTENCDVVILPETPDPNSNKMVVIPADKSILRMITYFNAQLNENHTWKETDQNEKVETPVSGKSPINFIELHVKTDFEIEPSAIFQYIKSLYTNDQSFLTKKNCVSIYQLSSFWCDGYMSNEAVEFIKHNINEEIYRKIMGNIQLQSQLQDVVDRFTKFIFLKIKHPHLCFTFDRITEFETDLKKLDTSPFEIN